MYENHMDVDSSIKYPRMMGLIIDPDEAAIRNKDDTKPVTGRIDSSVHEKIRGKIMDIDDPTNPVEIHIPS